MADNQEVMDAIAEQTVAAVQGSVEEPMAGQTAGIVPGAAMDVEEKAIGPRDGASGCPQ